VSIQNKLKALSSELILKMQWWNCHCSCSDMYRQ